MTVDASHADVSTGSVDTLSPADRYQELFIAVQRGRVFADSKTFVDCIPLQAPREILAAYRRECRRAGFDLARFVAEHFDEPDLPAVDVAALPDEPLRAHIARLWDVLLREPVERRGRGSLLPLTHPYVVPGGRFRELYYWDSYFTMLGLAADGRADVVKQMTDNFAELIEAYGHVPNANRSYYLSRSQPPAFVFMVELCRQIGVSDGTEYFDALRREHSWWMDGADQLRPGEQHRHCVRLPDGALLNRYWDDRDTPREEAYIEDVATAANSDRPAHELYRDLRAAAASGWDFSSRWCETPDELATTVTTRIVPVDLNAFLYELEHLIATLAERVEHPGTAREFEQLAEQRRRAIDTWLWSDADGTYLDLDLAEYTPRTSITAAAAAPLWVGIAAPKQAAALAATLERRLLRPGGLGTSEHASGQQWDQPNGWAPLQWMAIRGLDRYELPLGSQIAERWLHSVTAVYEHEHRLVEKYAMLDSAEETEGGSGGEYPLQFGFGWTNGVTAALLEGLPAS